MALVPFAVEHLAGAESRVDLSSLLERPAGRSESSMR